MLALAKLWAAKISFWRASPNSHHKFGGRYRSSSLNIYIFSFVGPFDYLYSAKLKTQALQRSRIVGGTGLEPVTFCMSSKRSNQAELTALLLSITYMGKEGVEPSRPYGQRILSPSCMPFHHLPNEHKIYVAKANVFYFAKALAPLAS